uniref:Ferric reductase putative n=1 Tax=Albugo laibachii Nc14 TaxID=890382 RepID=F0W340_9STRA|nr:ferric reductase putative [Albugo laibachii Nc14]|eukprot:CCA15480.1 ferric reductase putative [Albugo laibachii Nc14]
MKNQGTTGFLQHCDNDTSPAENFVQLSVDTSKAAPYNYGVPIQPLKEKGAGHKVSFMPSTYAIDMRGAGIEVVKNCKAQKGKIEKRRRRPDIDAMVRGSVGSRNSVFSVSAFKPSVCSRNEIETVPMLGDSSFQQNQVALSQRDTESTDGMTPVEKLEALRQIMGRISDMNGFVHRETFTQAFDMKAEEYVGYHDEGGMVNGNAILIDAMLDLDVGVQEKLRFIFDTVDTNQTQRITKEQMFNLLTSNFSNAKLEVVGMDLLDVVKLMFRRAGVHGDNGMTLQQFEGVFSTFVVNSYGEDVKKEKKPLSLAANVRRKSSFDTWYEANSLRFWWLLLYIILNNVAFWYKWFSYDVDPAMKYGLRMARGCAQVVMLNCLLVLLPMCRSITAVLKRSNLMWRYIPFDDHIEFHKICGTVLMVAGFIHVAAHISNEIYLYRIATLDEISRSIFVQRKIWTQLPPFSQMMLSIPILTGIVQFLIACISFPLAAIPRFRQGRFNLFWYSHMLLGPFLILMCFHGASSWLARSQSYIWIAPPFMLYLVERRFRYAKTFAAPVRIMEAKELDKTVSLFMEKPKRFVYRPGMYLYINCPSISTHEWHPFTISSAPGDNYLSVHIRNAGDWTGALHKLIADCHQNKTQYPDVYLDGPVGAPTQDYHRYKTIVCIAGGIGVTPFASILKDVVHLWEDFRCCNCQHVRHPSSFKIQKLYFHWTTRGQESLAWFDSTMHQISSMDKDNIIEAHQYLTTVKSDENSSQLRMFQEFVHQETGRDFVSGMKTRHLTHFGRPDWDQIFQSVRDKHPGEEIGVFFCGPHALDQVLAATCNKFSSNAEGASYFDYHSEKFA